MLTRQQAAAFDFDVVTDMPAKKPVPRPEAVRETAPPEAAAPGREKAEP
jgi:hypothetical protein